MIKSSDDSINSNARFLLSFAMKIESMYVYII